MGKADFQVLMKKLISLTAAAAAAAATAITARASALRPAAAARPERSSGAGHNAEALIHNGDATTISSIQNQVAKCLAARNAETHMQSSSVAVESKWDEGGVPGENHQDGRSSSQDTETLKQSQRSTG